MDTSEDDIWTFSDPRKISVLFGDWFSAVKTKIPSTGYHWALRNTEFFLVWKNAVYAIITSKQHVFSSFKAHKSKFNYPVNFVKIMNIPAFALKIVIIKELIHFLASIWPEYFVEVALNKIIS